MESQSIKEKIFYWGGIALISSVIIGGSYYIYKSIFGPDETDKNDNDNDNDSIGNSFPINDKNKNDNQNINNINNENHIDNNINNIKSSLFPLINDNNNIISTSTKKLNENNNIEENEIQNIDNNNPQKSINIFNNNKLLLKSFGLKIDESKIVINNNHLTDESVIRIIVYFNYLAQKFYLIDNPTLDQKRRALLNNNINEKNENNINTGINLNDEQKIQEEYLTLCNQAIEFQHNCYQIAADRILGSLSVKISFDEIQEFLKNVESTQLEKITIKIMMELNDELFKYDLDFFDSNKTKEAYIYYLKTYIEAAKNLYEEQEKMKNNEKEINEILEQNNIFIFKFMSLKMQMDDKLYINYHIVDDHLKLLVNKYNLSTDNEISQLQNEFDDFNNKIANPN